MKTKPSVLYVEDDNESRTVMQVLLEEVLKIGTLTIFHDSEDFLARVIALETQPDLILLDIHIKPYSGFEMLSMLREHPGYLGLPIVALTASVMDEEVKRLQTAGFDGVIAKPIDIDRFPQLVEQIMEGTPVWQITGEKGE